MMHDSIFDSLTPAQLSQICKLMSFDPVVSSQPFKFLSGLSDEEALSWLKQNPLAIEREITRLGSWSFGEDKNYREIVRDLAKKMGVSIKPADTLEQVERLLIVKIWNDAVSKLTPEQTEELKERAQQIASDYGKSLGKEMTGFAALTAAQMSGFGIYMLGSTLLGAVNGALGLGLSFGVFTGLSSLISTVIGPIGWAAVGMFAIVKLGAPNYKKLLPAVIFIAAQRPLVQENDGNNPTFAVRPKPILLPAYFDKAVVTEEPSKAEMSSGPDSVSTTSEMLAKFETEVVRATSAAKISKHQKAKDAPRKRIASKLDKLIFDQTPENKILRDVARESVAEHFLDLSEDEQADIRTMAKERQQIAELSEQEEKESAKVAAQGNKKLRLDSKVDDPSNGVGNEKGRRKTKNFLKAAFPNLLFSDRALDRYREYEGTVLHTSFAAKFRLLDQGDMADKHHVPFTSPKIFQMDCGGKGKLYYRRGNDGHSICIELIGDKNSQPRDLLALRSA